MSSASDRQTGLANRWTFRLRPASAGTVSIDRADSHQARILKEFTELADAFATAAAILVRDEAALDCGAAAPFSLRATGSSHHAKHIQSGAPAPHCR